MCVYMLVFGGVLFLYYIYHTQCGILYEHLTL